MSLRTRKLALAAGLTLALFSLTGVAAADSVSQDIVDARQESQIGTTFALSPQLRSYKLQPLVQSGLVRLTGTVAEDAEKELAGRIATEVKGVQEVNNQILVQSGYAPAPKSAVRSYGEAVDDAGIAAEVALKIAWSKSARRLQALVDTNLGTVRLRGTADSLATKNLAGRLAETTRGVTAVDNQLTVTGMEPSALEGGAAAAWTDGDDGRITARVKSTLLYSIDAAATGITVNTIGGDVTLTGTAKNRTERALAIELAQNVRGVRSVSSQGNTF